MGVAFYLEFFPILTSLKLVTRTRPDRFLAPPAPVPIITKKTLEP